MSETTPSHEPTSDTPTDEVPNPETGVGLGSGEASTFEPEEDPDAVPEEPGA